MDNSEHGTPFDSLSEERKKKIREIVNETIKNSVCDINLGVCGSYSPRNVNIYEPAYTCAAINKNACMSSPTSRSQKETMLDQLAKENKKLTQEKIKLNLKVLELQKQLKEAIDDKNKYKAFAEAEKGKVWKDLNKNIKSIYQKTIDWFNS